MNQKQSKELILHVGYPKTGTTTLQNSLFYNLHNENRINYLGITNPTTSKYHHNLRELLRSLRHEEGPDNIESSINELNLRIKPGKNLLSEEAILDHHPPNILINYFNDVDRFNVVVVIRNQVDLMYSMFAFYHARQYFDNALSIDDYIQNRINNNLSRHFLSYNEVINKYIKTFGEENVHVLLFEDFLFNREFYLEEWGRILSLENNILEQCLGESHYLKRAKNKNNEYYVNILKKQQYLFKTIKRQKLLAKLNYLLSGNKLFENIKIKIKYKKQLVPKYSSNQKNRIMEEFKEANEILAKDFGIDRNKLEKYGYLK